MVGGMESPPVFDLQAYEPPLSLWSLVEQVVSRHERNEIKNMLGDSLVEQSQELHEEIVLLLDIWRDYRDETNSQSPIQKLPEPPGIRERLVQEINFFVGNVREKAKCQGINPEKLLSKHNTDVIDYAAGESRPSTSSGHSRPSTALSGEGRETPMVYTPTGSDRASTASMLSEEVESMNDKLNVLKFDEVVQHLRQTLEEECEQLLSDINFLQQCLEDEATYRAELVGTLSTEPTLTELREERTMLEKDLLSPDLKSKMSPPSIQTTIQSHLRKLSPTLTTDIRMKHLHSLPSPGKTGPVKALHNLQVSPHPPPSRKNQDLATDEKSINTERLVGRDIMGINSFHKTKSVKSDINIGNIGQVQSLKITRQDKEDTDPVNKSIPHMDDGDCRVSKLSMKNSLNCPSSQAEKDSVSSKTTDSLTGVLAARQDEVPDCVNRICSNAYVPVPPTESRATSQRPNTAERFRKMVLNCRDTS